MNFLLQEQDANRESKSVIQQEAEVKESWNTVEQQAEREEAAKPRTVRQQRIEDDIKRLQYVPPEFDAKKEFRSKLAVFNPEKTDTVWLEFVAKPWDLSIKGIRKVLNDYALKREQVLQSFISERMEKLGPDLATAHFVCFRRGRCRFKGHTEWITHETLETIPNMFDDAYILEELEYNEKPLYYEGVENIRDLPYCKSIAIRNSETFDDWCVDRLSGNNLPALETLDLRGSTKITYKSMGCIYRLPALKQLFVTTDGSIEWKLAVAMLEEMNLNLKVVCEEVSDKK